MNIPCKPIKDKIVVRVLELESRTKSGLWVPPVAIDKHRSKDGIVEAVGPDCKDGIKVGDHVFFEDFAGSRLYHDSIDFLIVPEGAIMGVMEEDDGESEIK
jgi:chaperonin GroES